MQEFPHHYAVNARSAPVGAVSLATAEGAVLQCFPPAQFGGERGVQSPEYLLAEAVAGCYILSFRALARSSALMWENISCDAVGILDKVEGRLAFVRFTLTATLAIAADGDRERAMKLLEKAEKTCLISASLACPVILHAVVTVV